MCNCPTNALVCNKTLIQRSHTKTFKISPTCFDHQMIIIRELFDPGKNHWLKFEYSGVVMRQHTFIRFACCVVGRGMSTFPGKSTSVFNEQEAGWGPQMFWTLRREKSVPQSKTEPLFSSRLASSVVLD
jgi:hypothetical protein